MSDTKKGILLSIGIMTYNHEKFVEKLLLSVLNQKVDFLYNIIVVDDASTDLTPEILKKIRNQFPEKINLILNKQNNGALANAKILSENNQGKYMCFLDGDDCWTCPDKLQKQITFLEENPDYTGCFHDAEIHSIDVSISDNQIYKNQSFIGYKSYSEFNNYTSDFYPSDLIMRNIIPTSTLIFRKIDFSVFFSQFKNVTLSLNWAVHLYIIRNSKFRYFDEKWALYNDHPEGISKKHTYDKFLLSNIRILKIYKITGLIPHCRKSINKSIANEYINLYHFRKKTRIPLIDVISFFYYRFLSVF
ncbi:MAG: glycosyltransferase family 2 protein [Bacteroidota bacterium]